MGNGAITIGVTGPQTIGAVTIGAKTAQMIGAVKIGAKIGPMIGAHANTSQKITKKTIQKIRHLTKIAAARPILRIVMRTRSVGDLVSVFAIYNFMPGRRLVS
jgi:hypothetical protein